VGSAAELKARVGGEAVELFAPDEDALAAGSAAGWTQSG
jgi:hypothetical protein